MTEKSGVFHDGRVILLSVTNFWQNIRTPLLGWLGAAILRLLQSTLRWQYLGMTKKDWHPWQGKPVILAFWHNRQLMMPWSYLRFSRKRTRAPMCVLISEHRDGRLIASVIGHLGIESLAGSSSRGGSQALRALIRRVRAGSHVTVTPDGPRGPLYEVKAGVIRLAQKTGAQILPMTYSAKTRWTLRSWDKMIIPKPFSRAVMAVGTPLQVPEEISAEDFENYQIQLADELKRISNIADEYDYRN